MPIIDAWKYLEYLNINTTNNKVQKENRKLAAIDAQDESLKEIKLMREKDLFQAEEYDKNIAEICKHIHFRMWIRKNLSKIKSETFTIDHFLGKGDFGLVMKCFITWYRENEAEKVEVALKMIKNTGIS